jgi:50S ribosomal subunit-associated GTPase HflX
VNRKLDTCLDTFNEIGANGIPIISVLNKIDLVDEVSIQERIDLLREPSAKIIPISAKEHLNLDELIEAVEQLLPQLILYSITLPYGDFGMSILSRLHEDAVIESENYNENSIIVTARMNYDVFEALERELNPGSIVRVSTI